MKLSSKTIILTGAGSGMGRELAFQLLKKGANVAGVDIHAHTLEETRQLAGVGEDRFRGFVLDIADKAKVDLFPEEVLRHFDSVDGIINNAGIIQPFKPVAELSYEDIHRVTVGRDAALLDKLYRLNPRLATNFIGKMMKKTLAGMK